MAVDVVLRQSVAFGQGDLHLFVACRVVIIEENTFHVAGIVECALEADRSFLAFAREIDLIEANPCVVIEHARRFDDFVVGNVSHTGRVAVEGDTVAIVGGWLHPSAHAFGKVGGLCLVLELDGTVIGGDGPVLDGGIADDDGVVGCLR